MKKALLKLAVFSLTGSLLLTGCGDTASPSSAPVTESHAEAVSTPETDAGSTDLEEVVLEWYLPLPGPQQIEADVVEAANALIKEKINATVNFHFMDFSNYGQQMQLIHSAGTTIDLMFTSNWANDFYTDKAKGAYQELNYDRIAELAPNVIDGVSPAAWDAAKVGGKLYAIPNTQVQARWPSIMVKTEFLEKYDLDPASVQSIDDLTPMYEQIAANETSIYGIDVHKGSDVLGFYISKMGYEYFSSNNPLGVALGDDNLEVVNLYETEAMQGLLKTLRGWYEKGIIREDAATVTDTNAEIANGMYASIFAVNNPDTLVNQARLWNVQPEELTMIPLSDPFLSTGSIVATMAAIGQTSTNADRVYMLYNMLYDKEDTRLINLLSFGIEGVNYTKVEDNLIEIIPDSGWYVDCGWAYGSLFNCYRTSPDQPEWYPTGPDINNRAVVSGMLGFSMDPESIKSELAQISSVMDEYVPALMTGSVDVEANLELLNGKLEQAGMETVRAEVQRQLDEWNSAK